MRSRREKILVSLALVMLVVAWRLSGDREARVEYDSLTGAQLVWLGAADYVSGIKHGPDRDGDGIPELWASSTTSRGISLRESIRRRRIEPRHWQESVVVFDSRSGNQRQSQDSSRGNQLVLVQAEWSRVHAHRCWEETGREECLEPAICGGIEGNPVDAWSTCEIVWGGLPTRAVVDSEWSPTAGYSFHLSLWQEGQRVLHREVDHYEKLGFQVELLERGIYIESEWEGPYVWYHLDSGQTDRIQLEVLPGGEDAWRWILTRAGEDGTPRLVFSQADSDQVQLIEAVLENPVRVEPLFSVTSDSLYPARDDELALVEADHELHWIEAHCVKEVDLSRRLIVQVTSQRGEPGSFDVAFEMETPIYHVKVTQVEAHAISDQDGDGSEDIAISVLCENAEQACAIRTVYSPGTGTFLRLGRDA